MTIEKLEGESNLMDPKQAKRTILLLLSAMTLSTAAVGCAGMDAGNDGVRQQGMQTDRQNAPLQRQSQTGTNGANGTTGTNDNENRIRIANQAADQIVSLPGVRTANVLVTDNNAYVAAVTDDGQEKLSRETEDQIAEKVRRVDPSVRNVYVSTNPDFVDRINAYVADVQEGRPVAGFVEQFNEMIQRMFPDAR